MGWLKELLSGGWVALVSNGLKLANKVMDNFKSAELKKTGAEKVDLANRKKQDEVRKDADRVWKSPSRSRVRRIDGDNKR